MENHSRGGFAGSGSAILSSADFASYIRLEISDDVHSRLLLPFGLYEWNSRNRKRILIISTFEAKESGPCRRWILLNACLESAKIAE